MRILMLNQDWFATEWREAGHEVVTCGKGEQFDLKIETPLLQIEKIIIDSKISARPDVIVYHDNSMPISVLGLEYIDIPTLFYSVDAHHHVHWHKYYARIFDQTFVAQKDYLDDFTNLGVNAKWMPLWASRLFESSNEKKYQAVFVGTMDPDLNPERVEFLGKLKKQAPLEILQGEFWKIYPHSNVILNQTVKLDLNFRVFEGMISGVPLLTERSSNGIFDLFTEGKHLMAYEKNNVDDAAEQIRVLLSNKNLVRDIGTAGREEILRFHTPEVRAMQVMRELESLKKCDRAGSLYLGMAAYVAAALRYEKISTVHAGLCLTSACQLLENGMLNGEKMIDEVTIYAALACLEFDRYFSNKKGQQLVLNLCECHPESEILRMVALRGLLNSGDLDAARCLIKDQYDDQSKAFEASELVVRRIIDMKLAKQKNSDRVNL